jgi:hypothetical protein
MTRELLNLLGSNLQKVEAPSQIYHDGKFIGFPLSLFDLTVKLGPVTILKAGLELIHARMRCSTTRKSSGENQALLFLHISRGGD